jgi:predicted amidohydrolase
MDIEWGQPEQNFLRVEKLLSQSPPPPGNLIILPEMFSTGFDVKNPQSTDGCNGQPETTTAFLKKLAAQYQSAFLAGVITQSASEADAGNTPKRQNYVVLIDSQGIRYRYQKIHPFSYGGEDRFFESGNTISTCRWGAFTLSTFICYDLRFPEIFRHALNKGMEMCIIPANWPKSRSSHWNTLLKARAIENQCLVIGVNRVGKDPRLEYNGESQIIGPDGKILCKLDASEQICHFEIKDNIVTNWRKNFPTLKDRQNRWLSNL